MTRSDRRAASRTMRRVAWGVIGLAWLAAQRAYSADLHVRGSLGFGMRAVKQAADFGWDFDSAREETTLAVLQLGSRVAPNLDAFVSFGARLDALRSPDRPRFELREGSLRYAWRREARDSLALRLFALQPSTLWLDQPLRAPIDPAAPGLQDASGGRADGRWGPMSGVLIATQRQAGSPGESAGRAGGDLLLARLRADALHFGQLRAGATFLRLHPSRGWTGGDPLRADASRRDLAGADLRFDWHDILGMLQYEQTWARFESPSSEAAQEPGLRSHWRLHRSRRLTDILPSDASVRAELRSARFGGGRWGSIGFAPAYRALGAHYENRVVSPEPEIGDPRRGVEGYRLEAWYVAAAWPLWLRQVYDRSTQFRDADRRLLVQWSEVQGQLSELLRARLRYVQRMVHDERTHREERHDDLLGDLWGEDAQSRVRLQAALQELDSEARRQVVALEASASVLGHMKAIGRLSYANQGARLRRGAFVELQYWHLPEFEVFLQYGPEWIGDRADPTQDSDLTADGEMRDLVRLHFRGWF